MWLQESEQRLRHKDSMKIIMIRHGATKGNLEKRYVGSTDEAILEEAGESLQKLRRQNAKLLNGVEKVYISPMIRCRETADILFPANCKIALEGLRECEFGEFEYKNYQELRDNPLYQAYIGSNGECGFPGGETKSRFQQRCVDTFCRLLEDLSDGKITNLQDIYLKMTIAIVAHGGTIMSLLDAFSSPHRDYFDWQTENGQGYLMELGVDSGQFVLRNIKRI